MSANNGVDDPAAEPPWPSRRPELDEPARHLFDAAALASPQDAQTSLLGTIYRVADVIAAEASVPHPAATAAAQAAILELARMDPADVVAALSAARLRVAAPATQPVEPQPVAEADAPTGAERRSQSEATLQAFAHLAAGYLNPADWRVMQTFAAGCLRDGFRLPMERRLHLPTTENGKRLALRDYFLRQCLEHLPTPPAATPAVMARRLVAFWQEFNTSPKPEQFRLHGVPDITAPSTVAIHHVAQLEPDGPLQWVQIGRVLEHALAKKCSA